MVWLIILGIVVVIALSFLLYRFADTSLKIASNVVLALMIVFGARILLRPAEPGLSLLTLIQACFPIPHLFD